MPKYWGQEYQEEYCDEIIRWTTEIRHPFNDGGKLRFTLNEKFLAEAQNRGVDHILVKVGQKEIILRTPTKRALKEMKKNGQVKIEPGYYGKPFKLYEFIY